MRDITPLMEPRSIAVVGASTNPGKSGGIFFKNIVDGGFPGRLYPINPRADQILGHKAYPSIGEVPEPVDLAFIVLQREAVRAAVADCVRARARSVSVITSGFGEIGGDGVAAQAELVRILEEGGCLGVGPNTIGQVNREAKLVASFVFMRDWQDGPIAICAQTGIFAGAPMAGLMAQPYQRLGVSKVLDVGNKLNVDERDFLGYVADDAATGVVGVYVEGIPDVEGFVSAADTVRRRKPVVVLKPGRTAAGWAASALHTGSAPCDEAALNAGLERCGVVRAADLEDFLAYLKAFSYLPLPAGPRLGVVTTSGCLGVMASDEAADLGLEVVPFAADTLRAMGEVVPPWQPLANPCDVWIALDVVGPRPGIEKPLEAALADPGTDMVLGTILVPPNADFPEVREVFAGLRRRHPSKPLALALYGNCREHWLQEVEGLGIPVFDSSRVALRALQAMWWYRQKRDGTR